MTHLHQLYVKLYPETLQTAGSVEAFVRAIWEIIGGGKRPSVADDGVSYSMFLQLCWNHADANAQLVSQSLRFIASAIRTGYYKQLFGAKETISGLVQGVVVPNVSLRGEFRL